jgi:hypothetical protein
VYRDRREHARCQIAWLGFSNYTEMISLPIIHAPDPKIQYIYKDLPEVNTTFITQHDAQYKSKLVRYYGFLARTQLSIKQACEQHKRYLLLLEDDFRVAGMINLYKFLHLPSLINPELDVLWLDGRWENIWGPFYGAVGLVFKLDHCHAMQDVLNPTTELYAKFNKMYATYSFIGNGHIMISDWYFHMLCMENHWKCGIMPIVHSAEFRSTNS